MFRIYRRYLPLTGQSYIGKTVKTLGQRAGNKEGIGYTQDGRTSKFAQAIRKYGFSAFISEVLEITDDPEKAKELEKYYIWKYDSINNGFNTLPGGDCGPLGQPMKEEIKKKLSESHKGKRTGCIPWNKGKKTGIRPWNKGLKRPEFSKPVLQYTKEGELVAEYSSIKDAAKQTGIPASAISSVCNHKPKYKSAKGFVFAFKETV